MSPQPSPERDNTIEAIRALACLGVVVCHVAAPFRTQEATGNAWLLANLLDTLSRPAVGVFFMLAGMFALRQPAKITCRVTMKFYCKKWRTTVFPALAAVALYLIFLPKNEVSFADEPWKIFDVIHIFGSNAYPLWFMYPLTVYFLLTPIFCFLAKSESGKKLLHSVIAAWILLVVLIPSYAVYVGVQDCLSKSLLDFFNNCLYLKHIGWFLIGGYWLDGLTDRIKRMKCRCISIRIAFAVLCAGTFAVPLYLSSRGIDDPWDSWRDFVRPNIFLFTIATYLEAVIYFRLKKKLKEKFAGCAKLSFPAYIIHSAVICLFNTRSDRTHNALYLIIVTFLIVILTYMFSSLWLGIFAPKKHKGADGTEPKGKRELREGNEDEQQTAVADEAAKSGDDHVDGETR